MADTINHLRLVMTGSYSTSRPKLANEAWAMGINLYAQLSDIPDIGQPDGSFEAASELLDASDATWAATSNFNCEGGVTDLNPAELLMNEIRPAVSTFFASANMVNSNVQLNDLTLYAMKPKTEGGTATQFKVCTTDYGPAKAVLTKKVPPIGYGGYTGDVMPVHSSIVVSLRTPNVGPRGRGRIYLPPSTVTCTDDSGLLKDANRAAIATAAATFIGALHYSSGAPTAVAVRPVIIGPPGTTYFCITEVRVGNVIDAQRRRRRQLDEIYSVNAVTPA